MLSFINAAFRVFGDYLHLTRQHWISSLSLILPGNDDDRRLQATAGGKKELCFWQRRACGTGPGSATEVALRNHLTWQCWIVLLLF